MIIILIIIYDHIIIINDHIIIILSYKKVVIKIIINKIYDHIIVNDHIIIILSYNNSSNNSNNIWSYNNIK